MSSKRILIPKEHGAWAMLIMPYLVGVGVAGRLVPEAVLFLVAAVCCFAARYPLGLAVRSTTRRADARGYAAGQRDSALLWLAVYAGLGALSSAVLVLAYGRWGLLPLGLVALLLLALQPALQRSKLDRTVLGELLAFAGLAMAGPGAYYVSTGEINVRAAFVWLLTFLYAGASVFYVKLKVRQRVQRASASNSLQRWLLGIDLALYQMVLLVTVVLLAATRQIPWLVMVAFAPLTYKVIRDISRVAPELNLRRLGFVEAGHSLAFTALLIAAFAVH